MIPESFESNISFHQHNDYPVDPVGETRSIVSFATSNGSLNNLNPASKNDEMSFPSSSNVESHKKGPRGGITDPFPVKLHSLLDASSDEFGHIISWQPHGRCFLLHKPQEFLKQVMPHFFKQTKLTSFQRQLNLYGFHRLTAPGPDRGGYYHELFLRGQPELATKMMRCRIKGERRGHYEPEKEPDFYKMPFLNGFKSRLTMSSTSSLSSTSASSNCHSTNVSLSFPVAIEENPKDVPIESGTIMTFEGMEFHYLDAVTFLEEGSVRDTSSNDCSDDKFMWTSKYIL